ncbi:MAG: hypothetical protein CVU89_09280 [Firmicutes bacterium HGW-Firmicutes-14]|jgi:hypothetical protein|nr:MAG: hypothetical protein CVU89_09280 [Firmicutes bacterium HGW-Firmicutes-14]
MRFLIAGIIAAAVSWAGNRAALKIAGTGVIVFLSPLIEETAKSGTAFLTGSPLVLTHGIFGLIEGIYDAWGAGLRGLKAGLTGLAGHVFYGYATFLVLEKRQSILLAVIAGYMIHMLWNMVVLRFVVRKRR